MEGRDLQELLLRQLKSIRENGPRDECMGICSNVELSGMPYDDLNCELNWALKKVFRLWPEYSGFDTFPITTTKRGMECSDMYYSGCHKWSKKSKYGQARWRLLNFCIAELERQLKEEV